MKFQPRIFLTGKNNATSIIKSDSVIYESEEVLIWITNTIRNIDLINNKIIHIDVEPLMETK